MPFKIILACLLLGLVEVRSLAQASAGDAAPVQRYLDQETHLVSGSVSQFTNLTQPYAPLDFQVRDASNKQASDIRNYLFGVASALAGLDDDAALKMANDFHCGQPCSAARIKSLVEQHERVTPLVMRFVPIGGLNIIAQWNVPGEFRVNDTFKRGESITSYKTAGPKGVIPNSAGTKAENLTDATGLSPSEVSQAEEIAAELASLHLAAIVRSPQGIRVVLTGNADNQCGLLFKRLSVAEPKPGDSFGEGLDVALVVMIAKDIYYFETN